MERKVSGFLIPCATLAVGIYWLYASLFEMSFYDRSGPQTGFFPAIVAVLLILVSLILFFTGNEKPKKEFHLSQLLPMAGILGVMALGLLAGTIPALFVFVFAWLAAVEKYPLRFSLLIAAVSILIVWLVFDKGVGVMFQQGLIGDWLAG